MKVKLIYFKSSGKFYAVGETALDCPVFELPDAVISHNLSGFPMPGLRGSWRDGPILITAPDNEPDSPVYPMLILDPTKRRGE